MRVAPLGVACVVGAVIALASPGGAAPPLEREHYEGTVSDTFTDTECGDPLTIDYFSEWSGVFMLKAGRAGDPTPYYFDNFSGVETFTNVANGKTATLTHKSLFKDVRIQHVEGTVYQFTAHESGQPVAAIGPDGKKLLFDRGLIEYSFLVDTQGDAELDNDVFISEDDPRVAGPHPIFFGVADSCDLFELLR